MNMESKKISKIQKLIKDSLQEIKAYPHQSESMKLGYLLQKLEFINNVCEHGNVYGNEAEEPLSQSEFSKALQQHDDNDLRPL